jgi:glycosyltransferase involved in cell wall biosynthesis
LNILIVSSREPVPVHRGDQKLLSHRIQELDRRGHRIFLCFVHSSSRELGGLDELRRRCVAIYPHRVSNARRALNLLTRGASGLPLQVELFRDAKLRSLVTGLIAAEKIDVINAFLVRPFLAVEGQGVPLILDLVDSMQLNTRRRLEVAPRWFRPILEIEASRLARFEAHACTHAAASLVVARADRDIIGAQRLYVNPLGVDLEEFHPSPSARIPRRVVFSGNMDYHANRAALAWFVTRCLQTLRKQFPDVELVVAGKGSEELASGYHGVSGLRFAGRVDSMGDFLRTAEISIAPMRSGSGMQFKVLEAMACGVPTVVTRLGLGDIQAVHGEHTLVADEESSFIEAIRSLFGNEELRDRIGRAGSDLVAANHSWARNAEVFEQLALESLGQAP